MKPPWTIDGPERRPTPPALLDAVRRLHLAARRPPTDDDRPPPSTFPMTAAARAALRYKRQYDQ
jgi:hypothetical protein